MAIIRWISRKELDKIEKELDCKNPDLIAYKKKRDIMNKIKKELVDMFKNKK